MQRAEDDAARQSAELVSDAQLEAREDVLRYLGDAATATPEELAAIVSEWER